MTNEELISLKTALGERVKTLRLERNFGVRQFALLAEIEHHQLLKIEKGLVDPRFATIKKIAIAFEMPLSEFLNF